MRNRAPSRPSRNCGRKNRSRSAYRPLSRAWLPAAVVDRTFSAESAHAKGSSPKHATRKCQLLHAYEAKSRLQRQKLQRREDMRAFTANAVRADWPPDLCPRQVSSSTGRPDSRARPRTAPNVIRSPLVARVNMPSDCRCRVSETRHRPTTSPCAASATVRA